MILGLFLFAGFIVAASLRCFLVTLASTKIILNFFSFDANNITLKICTRNQSSMNTLLSFLFFFFAQNTPGEYFVVLFEIAGQSGRERFFLLFSLTGFFSHLV